MQPRMEPYLEITYSLVLSRHKSSHRAYYMIFIMLSAELLFHPRYSSVIVGTLDPNVLGPLCILESVTKWSKMEYLAKCVRKGYYYKFYYDAV